MPRRLADESLVYVHGLGRQRRSTSEEKHMSASLWARWLESYKTAQAELLRSEPGFLEWLENDYAPIGGAWQY